MANFQFLIINIIVFFMPVIIIPSPINAYRSPRTVFLAISAIAMLFSYLYSLFAGKVRIKKLSPIDIPIALLLCFLVVSVIANERRDYSLIVLIEFASLAIICYTSISMISPGEKIHHLIDMFIFSVAFTALVGIAENHNIFSSYGLGMSSFWDWSINWGERVDGTFDDPNFFGGFLAMGVPAALARLFMPGKIREKAFNASALVIILVAFSYAYSRSAFFSALAAIAFMFLLVLLKFRLFIKPEKTKMFIAAAMIVILLPMGLSLVPGLNPRNISITKRLSSSKDFMNEQGGRKLSFWRIGMEMMADKPLTGVGLSNYHIFYPYYRDKVYRHRDVPRKFYLGMTYDVYNDYIELGAGGGIPALAAYLLILCLFIYHGCKFVWHRDTGIRERWLAAGIMASALVFILHCAFFQFPMKNLAAFADLWVFMAALFILFKASRGKNDVDNQQATSAPTMIKPLLLASTATILILIIAVPFLSKFLKCSVMIYDIANQAERGRVLDSMATCENQINGCPHYKNDKLFLFASAYYMENQECDKAKNILEKAVTYYPYNYLMLNNLSNAYYCLGDRQKAQQTYSTMLKYAKHPSELK